MNVRPNNSTALIVVDVQNGFVNDNSRHILPNIILLIDAWASRGAPIFFTKFQNMPGSKWERLIGWTRLRSAPETDLHESIAKRASLATVVPKENLYTSLVGDVRSALDNGSISDFVLCGVATESCVLATAIGIFEHPSPHVRPFVVSDACASHAGNEAHQAGVLVTQRFIGAQQIVSTTDLLQWAND
jgi:nicotinamidase-related amidase